jgi:RNA polymerase sigma-70 factor (ECF subfamily)
LDEQQRLVFSLHYLDGYTYKEIAQGLDIPVGTVQTRCRAACKKLREVLRNMQTREEMQV